MAPVYSKPLFLSHCTRVGLVTNSIRQHEGPAFLRVRYKRLQRPSWTLHHLSSLSQMIHCGGGRWLHYKQPCGETYKVRNRSPWLTSGKKGDHPATTWVTLEFSKILQPQAGLETTTALANSLTASVWAALSQKYLAKPLPDT